MPNYRLRVALIAAHGGACSRCGYSRCTRALQFHHVDPSEKPKWSSRRGHAALAEVRAHPERFALLCANCHIEEHEAQDAARAVMAECVYCGRLFRTQRARLAEGRGRYCRRECHHADRTRIAVEAVPDRFWQHVERSAHPGACWRWKGPRCAGDPMLNLTRPGGFHRLVNARRISWELHRGKIPDRRRVQRRCENHDCVNPDHLYVLTS